MIYYTILYLIEPSISKFDLGASKFRPAARPMKVKADRSQKLISWAADHMLLWHQVWSWSDKSYSKNKGFVDTLLWPQCDLDLWPWNGAINKLTLTEGQLYKRCYIDVRLVEWEKCLTSNDYIQKKNKKTKKQMNHVAQRANSILQKPSPHSGMHWLSIPHSGMHRLREETKKINFWVKICFYVETSPNDVKTSKY